METFITIAIVFLFGVAVGWIARKMYVKKNK